MIGKKRCENCGWYQALDTFGICGRVDGRVDADPGFRCKHWIGIKYVRQKNKKMLKLALKEHEILNYEPESYEKYMGYVK